MNKGFTLLVSLVVLAAMGLVMCSHIGGKETPKQPAPFVAKQGSEARQGGFATPLQAPQGETGSLRSIEPPISNAGSSMASPTQPEGAPQPVRLTPSFDGNPPQPVALPEPSGVDNGGVPGTEPLAAATAGSPVPAATSSPEAVQPQERNGTPPAATQTTAGATPVIGSPGLTPWENPPQEAPATPSAQAQSKPQAAPPAGPHSLRNISLSPSGQGLVLQIEADNPFPCNAFVLTEPNRLVVDLPGSWQGMRIPSIPENRLVKNARLGQQPAGPRLVLDLAGPLKGHTIERSGNTTRIIMQ
jgi:hypothetical protein